MNVTGREGLPAIAVSWQAPPARDRNGDITEYKIKFNVDSPHTNPQVIPVTVEEDESNRVEWNYTIPGVQPGVRYIVGVAAATEAGTGDYAETVVDIPAEGTCAACRPCLHHHSHVVCVVCGVMCTCDVWCVYVVCVCTCVITSIRQHGSAVYVGMVVVVCIP